MDLNSNLIRSKYSVIEETYSFLKKSILEDVFRPGSRLYIDKISKQLGVSRTPVREAIKRLEVEGLVCSIPRRGPAVNVVSMEEVEEIQGIRAELESYGARLAIGRITGKELLLLEAIETRMEKYVKAAECTGGETPHWKTLHKLNWQFHSMILKASGSKKLFEIMDNLHNYLYRINMMIYRMPEATPIAIADHRKIIQAIKDKDFALVDKTIRSHILKGKELLLRIVGSSGSLEAL